MKEVHQLFILSYTIVIGPIQLLLPCEYFTGDLNLYGSSPKLGTLTIMEVHLYFYVEVNKSFQFLKMKLLRPYVYLTGDLYHHVSSPKFGN